MDNIKNIYLNMMDIQVWQSKKYQNDNFLFEADINKNNVCETCSNKKKYVTLSWGKSSSDVVVIGDAHVFYKKSQCESQLLRAAKLLKDMLESIELSSDSVFYMHRTLHCRCTTSYKDDLSISQDEIQNQVTKCKPKVIVIFEDDPIVKSFYDDKQNCALDEALSYEGTPLVIIPSLRHLLLKPIDKNIAFQRLWAINELMKMNSR